MVLAIGKEQGEELRERYEEFKLLFPKLKLLTKEEIELVEPNIVKDRAPDEDILALYTEEGYTIDFQKLAQSFLQNSIKNSRKSLNLMMGTRVKSIKKAGDLYQIQTDKEVIVAKAVVFTLERIVYCLQNL